MRPHGFLLRLTFAALVAATALEWTACSDKEAAPPQLVGAVEVATLTRANVQRQITASALLYPVHEAPIVPKISAPVSKFYVNRGDHVRVGELLVTLENKDLAAAVARSLGAYEQAQAAYATATEVSVPEQVQSAQLAAGETKQALDAAHKVYLSRLKLYQQGATARNILDQSEVACVQARNQYQIAEAHLNALQTVGRAELLKSAQAQLASARGQYLVATVNLNYSQIHSPIAGVVTSGPLVTVMNVSRVVARADVSPEQAAQLRVGDPATLSAGVEGDNVKGKVSVVSAAVDPNSATVQVWVEAANRADRLKPGSTVQVGMVAETVPDVLVVPAVAILTAADETTSVMVVEPDDVAHQTRVKTGIRDGNNVQILSGLKAGERVVIEGAYGLPDGTKVKF